jgi:recombinational DNA repair protein RecT
MLNLDIEPSTGLAWIILFEATYYQHGEQILLHRLLMEENVLHLIV